ncbi:uncharacterized protein TRIADDRAFT_60464 [Trichoplax adhaerens]|uniref:Uncharacterized protein n=1 Tax=Trichoplax adhaerens TaxID=10228 RepID=B3S8A1_TRIAD|nr:predicted protein [Trichoplax adhaerens]EDV21162.1 predicted protein [Trichoplax adhaerens]|eukprot:XP_002116492.1 predicted protein [Trichoplax adhaerens]
MSCCLILIRRIVQPSKYPHLPPPILWTSGSMFSSVSQGYASWNDFHRQDPRFTDQIRDDVLHPRDSHSYFYPSKSIRRSRPLGKITKARKASMHLPKTFMTKKGALYLFSSDISPPPPHTRYYEGQFRRVPGFHDVEPVGIKTTGELQRSIFDFSKQRQKGHYHSHYHQHEDPYKHQYVYDPNQSMVSENWCPNYNIENRHKWSNYAKNTKPRPPVYGNFWSMNHFKPQFPHPEQQKKATPTDKPSAARHDRLSYHNLSYGAVDNQQEIDVIRQQIWSKFKALPKINRLRHSRVASKASSGEDPAVAAYSHACVLDTDDGRDEIVSPWKPTPPSRRKQRTQQEVEDEDSEDEFQVALQRVQPPKIVYQQLNRSDKEKLISKLIIHAHLTRGTSGNQDVSIVSASTRGSNSPVNQDVTALVPPHPRSHDSESIDSGFTAQLPSKESKYPYAMNNARRVESYNYESSEGTQFDTDRLNVSLNSSDGENHNPAVINIQSLFQDDGSFPGQSLPFNSTEGHHATMGTASPKKIQQIGYNRLQLFDNEFDSLSGQQDDESLQSWRTGRPAYPEDEPENRIRMKKQPTLVQNKDNIEAGVKHSLLEDKHYHQKRHGINPTNLSEYPRIGWKRSNKPSNSITTDYAAKDTDGTSTINGHNYSVSSGKRKIIIPNRITFGAEHNFDIFDEVDEDDDSSNISIHSDGLPKTGGMSARPVVYDRPQSAPQSSPLLKARLESRASVHGGGRSPYSRALRPASAKASITSHDSGHDSIAAMYNDKAQQRLEDGKYLPRLNEWLDTEEDFTNVQDVLRKLKDESQSTVVEQSKKLSRAISRGASAATSMQDWQSVQNKLSDAVIISSLQSRTPRRGSTAEGVLPPILVNQNVELEEDHQQNWAGDDLENSSLINLPDQSGHVQNTKSAFNVLGRVASRVAQSVFDNDDAGASIISDLQAASVLWVNKAAEIGSYIGGASSFGKGSIANHKDLDNFETESKLAENQLFVSATETEFTQRLQAIAAEMVKDDALSTQEEEEITELAAEKIVRLPSAATRHSKDDLDLEKTKISEDLLEWQHSTDDENASKAAILAERASIGNSANQALGKAISIPSQQSEIELQPDVSHFGDDETVQEEEIEADVDDPFHEVDQLLSPDHVHEAIPIPEVKLTAREKERLVIESSMARLKQFLPQEMKKIAKAKSPKKQVAATFAAPRDRKVLRKPSMSDILGNKRSKLKKKPKKKAKVRSHSLVSESEVEVIPEETEEIVLEDDELDEELDMVPELPADEGGESKIPRKSSQLSDEESDGEYIVKLSAAERRRLAAEEKRQRVLQRRLERQEMKKREAEEAQRIEVLKRKAEEEMRRKQEEYERAKREQEERLKQEEEERYIRIREEEERQDREKRLMEEARNREAELREKLKQEEEERLAALRRAKEAEAKRRAMEEEKLRLMEEAERQAILELKRKEEEERLRLLAEKERLDKIRHEREENERRNLEKKMMQLKLKALQRHFMQLGINKDHNGIKKFSNITRSFVFSYFDLLPEMVRRDAARLNGKKPERELIASVEKMLELEDV